MPKGANWLIDHTGIGVSNIARSAHFYLQHCGHLAVKSWCASTATGMRLKGKVQAPPASLSEPITFHSGSTSFILAVSNNTRRFVLPRGKLSMLFIEQA